MTEKELHRLRRQDLLQLLLAQGKDAAQLQNRLEEAQEQLAELQETKGRFIGRMDDKDAQIEKLKSRLDEKDGQIEKLKSRLGEKDTQIEKFKEKLEEKDAQIARLKNRLDEKDIKIQELRMKLDDYLTRRKSEFDQADTIAEIGVRLNHIFTLAQKAVERKLEDTKRDISNPKDPNQQNLNQETPGKGDLNQETPGKGDLNQEASNQEGSDKKNSDKEDSDKKGSNKKGSDQENFSQEGCTEPPAQTDQTGDSEEHR